jgi:hypothetical protein
MATLSFKGLSPGATADLYYAAQVEPYKQAHQKPPWAPIATAAVDASGNVSFASRPSRIEHVAFVNGLAHHQMDSTTRTK